MSTRNNRRRARSPEDNYESRSGRALPSADGPRYSRRRCYSPARRQLAFRRDAASPPPPIALVVEPTEPQPHPARREFCRFFMAGHCANGNQCQYRHYESGVRPPNINHLLGRNTSVDDLSYEQLLELTAAMGDSDIPQREAEQAAERLPTMEFRRGSRHPDTKCVICQENFIAGDRLLLLRCDHRYHESCIRHWLEVGKPNCPVCKADVRETD